MSRELASLRNDALVLRSSNSYRRPKRVKHDREPTAISCMTFDSEAYKDSDGEWKSYCFHMRPFYIKGDDIVCRSHGMTVLFTCNMPTEKDDTTSFKITRELFKKGKNLHIVHTIDEGIRFINKYFDTYKPRTICGFNVNYDVNALMKLSENVKLTAKPVCIRALCNNMCVYFQMKYQKVNKHYTPKKYHSSTLEHYISFIRNDSEYVQPHTAFEDVDLNLELLEHLLKGDDDIPSNTFIRGYSPQANLHRVKPQRE